MDNNYAVWDNDIAKILITEKELDETVTRLSREIARDYADKNLLLLSI